jgi:XTP/dITP diphosphohydrolase
VCEGIITAAPSGTQGFGYDPVFYVSTFDQTMAQLSIDVKNKISHRARAAQKMIKILTRAFTL